MKAPACFATASLCLAAASVTAQEVDLGDLLCDPADWSFDSRFVSITRQKEHLHAKGPGLLFAYTRKSSDLRDRKGRFDNRAYRPTAVKQLTGLDLSQYRGLSFWVYVEGNAEEAFQFGFDASKPFRLSCRRGEWFQARWKLTEIGDRLGDVKRITFAGVNQGAPPGDPQQARIFLSDFRLEETGTDVHIGWSPAPDEIVLPYSGVLPGESLSALVAAEHAGKPYTLTGHGVEETGTASSVRRSARTQYAEITFRAPETEGDFRLTLEPQLATTLCVRSRPYATPAGLTLRAIRAQRCGCASELHGPCHLDDAVRDDTGEHVDVSGGWHDEGVSQYTHLTVRTTAGLARLCRRLRQADSPATHGLTDALLAEVEWGTRSVLKYEIAPNEHYHSLVAPYWFHTDNQSGTGDERKIVLFHPHQLSCWWRTEALALAAGVVPQPLASRAKALAERYWMLQHRVEQAYTSAERKRWRRDSDDLRVVAARLCAAVEMYRLTGETSYAEDAARTAGHLLSFQVRDPIGHGGLRGAFRTSPDARTYYTGVNGKSLDVPGRALAEVLTAMPEHADAPTWREALSLYADGTLKRMARRNAPYGCVAAGPFTAPLTRLFEGERLGDAFVYPLHLACTIRKNKELLRLDVGRSQLGMATQLAAVGRALGDKELLWMAHAALRYLLGANPSHVSLMRHFGERFPVNAQLPNLPGVIVGWLGITTDGLPFFDPLGAGRLEGPTRFAVKEGNTAMCAALLDTLSYLE